MKKWIDRWNKLSTYEKIFSLASWILMILSVIMLLFGGAYQPLSNTIGLGMMAASCGCLVALCWKDRRSLAVRYLVLTVFLAVIAHWDLIRRLVG